MAAAREEDLLRSERIRSITNLHLTPEEAGEVFSRSNPELAVYTHMVLYATDIQELIRRTRRTYTGPLEIGEDLMVFEVGEKVTVHRP